ncbi:protein of unknown function [Rhizobium mongolense subsp. loessense]|uniref:YjiS-like domain-containing protein n=1 Tax=Rhizobium mongolense subsp. loessense TaxID=158890 RepID=A0A1G4SCX8_9HYPH|nr:DUF1127 domain-containing protein [Rhizobium mongolense]SCW66881.1 protein of unknown function [Rhizobium mongolense subsp. loessense]
MADIRTDRPISAAAIFQILPRFLRRGIAIEAPGCTELASRRQDRRTFQALAKLSDEHLRDIGVYRKPCGVKSDYLSRDFHLGKEIEFAYYRLDE